MIKLALFALFCLQAALAAPLDGSDWFSNTTTTTLESCRTSDDCYYDHRCIDGYCTPNSGPPEGIKFSDLIPIRRAWVGWAVREKGFQCPPEALKVENFKSKVLQVLPASVRVQHDFDVVCPGGAVERWHASLYQGPEVMFPQVMDIWSGAVSSKIPNV